MRFMNKHFKKYYQQKANEHELKRKQASDNADLKKFEYHDQEHKHYLSQLK